MESEPQTECLDRNEALTNFVGADNESDATAEGTQRLRQPGHRGRQKRPTKILVTMRFSPEILAYFKASGEGWQTRMNDVLREYVEQKNTGIT